MNANEILKYAEEMVQAYGLVGWKVKVNGRFFNVLGRCKYRTKTIELSKAYIEQGTQEHINDTILHEIAHALVGEGHGHGIVWQRKAREIGAIPKRCSKTVKLKGKYEYVCNTCGNTYHRTRKMTKLVACGICCTKYNYGRYSPQYVYQLAG